ncbi:MAG: heme-binding beta-barrel domain-containing protein [Acidiferrobacterales bacterium]
MIEATMRRLLPLQGSWGGKGVGGYPTIESFEYEETLRFELNSAYPLIHYEQRTLLVPSREPSHWECGFIRPLEDGSIEISNAQDSGRIEVLRGRLIDTEREGDDLRIALDSVVLDHDPRLVCTRRTFTVRANTLRYVMDMSTHTTPAPQLGQHLEAVLKRIA